MSSAFHTELQFCFALLDLKRFIGSYLKFLLVVSVLTWLIFRMLIAANCPERSDRPARLLFVQVLWVHACANPVN